MPSKVEDNWSDSDSEYDVNGDIETAVQLGLPDGSLSSVSDLRDPCVSRIGGRPAFFPNNEPEISCSQCKNCSFPMEMAIQIWCPLEGSPMDRTLYVWACSKGSCQKKDGSVRAWRGLRLNEKYAAKLARKAAAKNKELEAQKAKAAVAGPSVKTNPFSLGGNSAPDVFGLGSQIFGTTPAQTNVTIEAQPIHNESDSDSDSSSSSEDDEIDEDLAKALESTKLDDSSIWNSTPSYAPLYLSSISEYIPPPPKEKAIHVDDGLDDRDRKNQKSMSVLEAYENSMNLDEVFSRFSKRVSYEGEQCIRYELNGIPLPYAADAVFDKLFPPAEKRSFSLASIPPCQQCKSRRVFECQLMPNLINTLKSAVGIEQKLSDEERRKLVEKELKNKDGMGWGTCMIFSCEADCSEIGWTEEDVRVQWE